MADKEQAPPRVTGHVIAYEHPLGSRRGGIVALSQYRTPNVSKFARRHGRTSLVRVADPVPEGVTGKNAAPLLARFLDSLPEPAEVRLFLGVTFGGNDLARDVIAPGLEETLDEYARRARADGNREAEARARRSLRVTSYAVDVGPAAANVDKVITVNRRTAAVAAGLELEQLKIPDNLRGREELRRAILTYDPRKHVTDDGRDTWGVDPYEGVLSALTVAYTESQGGYGSISVPIGSYKDGTAGYQTFGPDGVRTRFVGPIGGGPPGYVDLGGGLSGTVDPSRRPARMPQSLTARAQNGGWANRRISDVAARSRVSLSEALAEYEARRRQGGEQ